MPDRIRKYRETLSNDDKAQFLLALAVCFAFTGLAIFIMHPLPLLIWACVALMAIGDYMAKKSGGLLDEEEAPSAKSDQASASGE